jgi:hypothetical protein
MDLNDAAVEIDHAVVKSSLAEASASRNGVSRLPIDEQGCGDFVKIAITPTPKVKVVDSGLSGDGLRSVGSERDGV